MACVLLCVLASVLTACGGGSERTTPEVPPIALPGPMNLDFLKKPTDYGERHTPPATADKTCKVDKSFGDVYGARLRPVEGAKPNISVPLDLYGDLACKNYLGRLTVHFNVIETPIDMQGKQNARRVTNTITNYTVIANGGAGLNLKKPPVNGDVYITVYYKENGICYVGSAGPGEPLDSNGNPTRFDVYTGN